jgi:uncharacterized repeat protein (TIGR02543 family)
MGKAINHQSQEVIVRNQKSFHLCVFILVMSTIFIIGATYPRAGFAALTLYDDFSGTLIDQTKWASYEKIRTTRQAGVALGKLWLMGRSSTGTTDPVMSDLIFADHPESIESIRAQITLASYANQNGAMIFSVLAGRFYNDGSSTDGYTGDVLGQVGIGGTGATPKGVWTVVKCVDAACSKTEILASGEFAQAVSLNTPYTFFLSWDGGKYIFKMGSETQTYTPTGTVREPTMVYKALYVRIGNAIGKDAIINSYIDNVYVKGSFYDDFSTGRIDMAKWLPYDFVRIMKDGALTLVSQTGNNSQETMVQTNLPMKDPENITALQAKVTPKSLFCGSSSSCPGNRVKVVGTFFNDGSQGGGNLGDISADVGIRQTSSGQVADYSIVRHMSEDDRSLVEIIKSGTFKTGVSLEKPYTLYVGFDGSDFTFKINKETITYANTMSVNAAKMPYKGLAAAIYQPQGRVAAGWAAFDDVKVLYAGASSTLTVTKSGSGIVTSDPSGIDCGDACSASFADGATVTLTAAPAAGYGFDGWSGGGCPKTGACNVTMSDNITVTASFKQCSYTFAPRNKKFTYKNGSATVNITAKGARSCPAPEVAITQGEDWITLSGVPVTFTNNKGTVIINVPENTSPSNRTGEITIAGGSLPVTQTGTPGTPCTLAINPASSEVIPKAGGTGSFTVTATPVGCAWTAARDTRSTWVTITSGDTGTGTGIVTYTVDQNTGKTARSGKINVSLGSSKIKKTYTVKQGNK